MPWGSSLGWRIGVGLFRLESAGVENIERHVLRLTDLLIGKLQEKGYQVVSSLRPKERSGIVAFTRPSHNSEIFLQRLSDAGIVVSACGCHLGFRAPLQQRGGHRASG